LLLIAIPVIVLNLTMNFFISKTTALDYSDWMLETLDGGRRVIDVAMLGAHDAMTSDISYFSKVDPLSAGSIQTGLVGALIKGFSVKQSKTQMSSTADLLARGVRYFDVRLTYNEAEEAWYTTHLYFSRPFSDDLAEIETFLADHPGEFVLIDIQHVYGVAYDDEAGYAGIHDLIDASGLFDRAVRDDAGDTLADLTYDDVTLNKTRGGVIIFSKFTTNDPSVWDYGTSIRSAWANTDDEDAAFAFLAAEADLIDAGTALTGNQISGYVGVDSRQGIRVMQAVLTMQMSGSGILTGIGSWSLIAKARGFNAALIERAEFLSWLASMPVVMVDYADSNHLSFNDALMELIVSYNQSTEI
ncbi:MAG: hypothetical protein Q8N15_06135, partial [Bacillota bacterium]|nr:hypothetical protein [Bacillota bacterium]